MAKKIAVILSGCGNKDGAEITESVCAIVSLSLLKADLHFFAPNQEFEALNFLTNQVISEKRNIMVESARITRSNINDLAELNPNTFDGLVLPGGFGVATHLSTWAKDQSKCTVNPLLQKLIESFHQESKPICAICIAPAVVARVLGSQGVTVTLGKDKQIASEIQKTGATAEICPSDDFITDRLHKVITTPAYMDESATPGEVFKGIQRAIAEFMEMA